MSRTNPVRARLDADPVAYRWSSYQANLGQRGHSALTPHPCWLAPGNDLVERSDAFRAMVEAKAGRFASVRPAHRPHKSSVVD
ncbi:hypothetical protein XarjCFBP7645_18700 [Xanthomonas arboricola]|uniref:Transposase n=1 Tax=Xanthomonas arboricola TaxID=56448 RepID=A0A2S7ABG9_9XANT|nr:hypothetical protein XarjCFBP7645_18700 [Xanthomonas arboricola]